MPDDSQMASRGPERGVDHHFHEDLAGFYKEIDETLIALQVDFLSEPTRREQRLLIGVAFVLILTARGTIRPQGTQTVELIGAKLAIDFGGTFVAVGAIVCAFLAVTYGIRAYADWTSFSIRRARLEALIEVVATKLENSSVGLHLREFEETEAAIRHRSWRGYDSKAPVDWNSYNIERSDYNRAVWGLWKKKTWVSRQISRVQTTRRLRFWFELLFPLVFACAAMLSSYYRALQ
jgi:hypothetical protein